MFSRHIPLADQTIKLLHRAFSTFVNICASCTCVKTFFRRMSFAATLLTCQPFPTSTIVMLLQSTMGTSLMRYAAILITVMLGAIQSSILVAKKLNTFRCGPLSSWSVSIRAWIAATTFHMDRSYYPSRSDGVGVEADVGRCQNFPYPIALWYCRLSMRWYVRNVSSISSASCRRNTNAAWPDHDRLMCQ